MDHDILNEVITRASYKNPWFTYDNVRLSFDGLVHYLEENKIGTWLTKYDLSQVSSKNVGVVMAGNIPMVGIHDMICVLISGHNLIAKLSSQDDVLIPFIADELIKIESEFKNSIQTVEQLKGVDAVIATGSDNSARYFDYYFSKYPNIIRKNRTSIAIINGDENTNELKDLGQDLFSYFGLGCRNVSKLFLPTGYDIKKLISHLENFKYIIDHNKYGNNYFYRKSIFLVNQIEHLDNGFALFHHSDQLVSPISVIYYDYYNDLNSLKKQLIPMKDKIQCIVSNEDIMDKSVIFGKAQMPEIWDYADHIDTLDFLTKI
ncbi:MAG: acyl-CoA reductase [Cyclobacteriaceae bacterium]|nr:acyl-CoA reductase [Cyclobacteriaceae bacterium]MCK5701068.1 acyl-CoA reductase [Cyclobacteriaceae bacterium]